MTILHFFPFLQDLQDDLGDMLEEANEVQEALGRSYGKPWELVANIRKSVLWKPAKIVCFDQLFSWPEQKGPEIVRFTK